MKKANLDNLRDPSNDPFQVAPLARARVAPLGRATTLRKPEEPTPVDYSQPQSYTPKFLADKILTTRSSIEGERKLVTVLFADVANYTSISEKLDPEDFVNWVGRSKSSSFNGSSN